MSVSEQALLEELKLVLAANPVLGKKQLLALVCEKKGWKVGHKRSRVILKKFKDFLKDTNICNSTPSSPPSNTSLDPPNAALAPLLLTTKTTTSEPIETVTSVTATTTTSMSETPTAITITTTTTAIAITTIRTTTEGANAVAATIETTPSIHVTLASSCSASRRARADMIKGVIQAIKRDNPDFGIQRVTRACAIAGITNINASLVKNVMKSLGMVTSEAASKQTSFVTEPKICGVTAAKKRTITEGVDQMGAENVHKRRADAGVLSECTVQRQVPHVAGNWSTHVYIPIPCTKEVVDLLTIRTPRVQLEHPSLHWRFFHLHQLKKVEEPPSLGSREDEVTVAEGMGEGVHDGLEGNDMKVASAGFPELHLSLSRNIYLRAYQICAFVDHLRVAFKGFYSSELASSSDCRSLCSVGRSFFLRFSQDVIYFTNDTKTTLFACIAVFPSAELMQLLHQVNLTLKAFQLQEYYDNPILHVTFASASLVAANDFSLRSVTAQDWTSRAADHVTAQVDVHAVRCKIGNKLFQIPLK